VAMRRWAARLRRYWPGLMLGAVLALCVAFGWALLAPARLSVAVSRHDAAETGVIAAYAQALAEHHKGLRLRLHTFALIISLDSARAAILDRRRELVGGQAHLVPGDALAAEALVDAEGA
jgi:hypothetical protein